MPRTERRILPLVLLLALSVVILLLDLLLNRIPIPFPDTSGQQYPWSRVISWFLVRFITVPLAPVIGWPLGLWFWRYARLQQGAIERTVPRILAFVCWLFAALMVFGLLRSWFLA